MKWISDNKSKLSETTRSKFYVALTLARINVAIVVMNDKYKTIDECQTWTPS